MSGSGTTTGVASLSSPGSGLIVPPVEEPVSLAEAKLHLRVDDDLTEEDTIITALITAAREHVEDVTRRALLSQTWDYSLRHWPGRPQLSSFGTNSQYGSYHHHPHPNAIKLPLGNLQSVTSVKYKDAPGAETTMTENTDYIVEKNGEKCGRIVLPYGMPWPSVVLYPSNPIVIRYSCGWSTVADVPAKIRAAMLMIIGDLYTNREAQFDAISRAAIVENTAVQRLLASSRLWDEFL